MPCAICGIDPPICLLLLLLLRCVLPLWSSSHLTKRHANHSAARASLAACGSFNRCQCASYGRRFNQLLNSDRESGSNAHSITVDVNQPRRRQGEILVGKHFISLLGLIFISYLIHLGLEYQFCNPVDLCAPDPRARQTYLEADFFSVGGEV